MLVLRFLNGTTIRGEHWRPHVGRLGPLLSLSTLSTFPYPCGWPLELRFHCLFPIWSSLQDCISLWSHYRVPKLDNTRVGGGMGGGHQGGSVHLLHKISPFPPGLPPTPCRGCGRGLERQPWGNLKHTDSLHANKWPFILVSFSFKLASKLGEMQVAFRSSLDITWWFQAHYCCIIHSTSVTGQEPTI